MIFQEDFLDLTLAVAGYAGVTDTLESYYVTKERMEGDNRYRCERCNKLVNAKKVGCRIIRNREVNKDRQKDRRTDTQIRRHFGLYALKNLDQGTI